MNKGTNLLWSALAGLLMSFSHDQAPWLAVLGIAIICECVRTKTPRTAIMPALLFGSFDGLGFWSFILNGWDVFGVAWLMHLFFRMTFVILLPLLFRGRFGTPITVASLWCGIEYIRTLLAWNPAPLGDGFAYQLWFIQIADLGGTYLVGFVVVWLGASLHAVRNKVSIKPAIPAVCALIFSSLYSLSHLQSKEQLPEDQSLNVALVQASIPYWFYKFAAKDFEFSQVLKNAYTDSLSQVPSDVELIVWPETALPHDPSKEEKLRETLSSTTRPALLAGLPRYRNDGINFNSVWYIEPGFERAQIYDKRKNVPVIEAGLGAGTKGNVLGPAEAPIAPVICWESVFPSLFDHAKEAKAIAVFTDPGAFRHTNIAELHARKTVLRAIERRRPAIHSSQVGPSLLIDSNGEVTHHLPVWKSGILIGKINLKSGQSIFTRTEGVFAPLTLGYTLVVLLFGFRRQD